MPHASPKCSNRVILKAKRLSAPAQLNIPRDFWTQVIDINLRRSSSSSVRQAAITPSARRRSCLSEAKFPVILSGAGVVLGMPSRPVPRWLKDSTRPSATTTSTMTVFPGSHRLAVGPLGYNGSKAAMELIAKADVVLALGTAAQSVLDASGLWHRLLAQQREDHPGRHQRRSDRPDQAGHGRHLRRCQACRRSHPGRG